MKQESKKKINILCKGCPKQMKDDLFCASTGEQRRCPIYKRNREIRKMQMPSLK